MSNKRARPATRNPAAKKGAAGFLSEGFDKFASEAAHLTGTRQAFLLAVLVVLVWAVTGPLFGYSDTWQLVINTGTTIVTFLMVFLIQATQNRDTAALQVKLSELILAAQGAENKLASVEDLSQEELDRLHDELRRRAAKGGDEVEVKRAAVVTRRPRQARNGLPRQGGSPKSAK